MTEVVALRAILLNVLFKQSNGERLTAEETQRIIDRPDSGKLKKAARKVGTSIRFQVWTAALVLARVSGHKGLFHDSW
jgi:hypothetical protein